MRTNLKTNESTCKNCNKTFVKVFDSNKVHCSERCRKEYRFKTTPVKIKPIKICPKCKKEHNKDSKFCSRSCGNSRDRPNEFKEKLRIWAKANPRGWAANHKPNLENLKPNLGAQAIKTKWAKFRQSLSCKECNTEFTVAYSARNRKYCSVACSNKNKYHPNSNRKKTSNYKGVRMESGAELIFAQQCDQLGIIWHKNSTQFFPFIDSTGKQSKYYPDFYLEMYDIWVEIKGKRYIRPDDELRRAAVGKPVFLIISNQFKTDFEKFKEFINGKFLTN